MYQPTYERSYGPKYNQPKDGRAPTIAKLIRMDIRQAILAGDLPGKPSNYRVRSHIYSMGQSIRVTLVGMPELYQVCEGIVPGSESSVSGARSCGNYWCKAGGRYSDSPHAEEHLVLTAEGRRILELLEEIQSAYNHDGSDSQVDYFDVRYYGGVDIEMPEQSAVQRAAARQ